MGASVIDQSIIKHPVYIISKGRANRCLFARYLHSEDVEFRVAVEPQEYDDYAANLPSKYLLKLDFSNLGMGSTPARNACWDDAIKRGFEKHFIFDDNIYRFIKMERGLRRKSEKRIALESLYVLQAFQERYKNLPLAGYNYSSFAGTWTQKPFYLNTHVYSGMLIENSCPFRWRLKYNEDVDLNLQILHAGKCTVLLNMYLIQKVSTTAKMPGGNQTELYKNNDPRKKALKTSSLQQVWPQYVESTFKYGRPHHHVSWKKFFKHQLHRVSNYEELLAKQMPILSLFR